MSNPATIFVEPAQRGRPVVRGDERDRAIPTRLALVPAEPDAIAAPPAAASSRPTSSTVRTTSTTFASVDARLVAILDRAPDPSETLLYGFARKEAELRASFADLTVNEARAIHKRLSLPQPSDVLAQKFGRLTAERRARLINFLADARRRAALASGKR